MANIVIPITPNAPPTPGLSVIAHTARTTAFDIVERLLGTLGGNPVVASDRDFKIAVLDAYREFGSIAKWAYFVTFTRIPLNGKFNFGTIQFQVSSGAVPNLLTLSGFLADGVTPATWPSWALQGGLRLPSGAGSLLCTVKKVLSSTQLQLNSPVCPTADIAAGAAYSLYRDTYSLPEDYVAGDRGLVENNWGGMTYIRPHEWLTSERYLETYGPPSLYTVRGDPQIPGRLAMSLYPFPDTDQSLDFIYSRRMREIRVFDQHAGNATALLAAPTTVTLSGATFTPSMAGSVIRFAASGKLPPTGITSDNPYACERTILEVTSTTTALLDAAVDQNYAAIPYRLSDPIDLEDTAMLNAFVGCAYKFLGRVRRFPLKEQKPIEDSFLFQLELAKEADSRNESRRSVELYGGYRRRMRDMPRGPDIS